MEPHFSFTDAKFERLFQNRSFEPALFTHEAHIRLAWIHIRKYGLDKASYNIVSQLQEYTKALDVPDKFDLALTIASLKTIHHYTEESRSDSFEAFILEFPKLTTHFSDLLVQRSKHHQEEPAL
ncbi:hypothetical protein [Flavobacterium sp.]|uniref:hypothetical protein n=1 Tax=Flavobacterium sp. TaxID=239 RepID=UPI00403423C6